MASQTPFRASQKPTRRLRPQADPFVLPEQSTPRTKTPSPPKRQLKRPVATAPPFIPSSSSPLPRTHTLSPDDLRDDATRTRERAMGEIVSTLQTMNKTLEDYIRTSRPVRAGSPEQHGKRAPFSPDRREQRSPPRRPDPQDGRNGGLQMVAVRPVYGRRDRVAEMLHWLSALFGGWQAVDTSRGSAVQAFGCCAGAKFFITEVCQSVEGYVSDLGRRFGL